MTDTVAQDNGLNSKLLPELRAMAADLGIEGAAGMRKAELVEEISAKQSSGRGKRSASREAGEARTESREERSESREERGERSDRGEREDRGDRGDQIGRAHV